MKIRCRNDQMLIYGYLYIYEYEILAFLGYSRCAVIWFVFEAKIKDEVSRLATRIILKSLDHYIYPTISGKFMFIA